MKTLQVATDFYDEIYSNHRFPQPQYIEAMMAYVRSLGAKTIEWVVDDMWALYDAYPGGVDLLRCAVEAAHAQHLEFTAVYKPLEGGLETLKLPHSFPRPTGAAVWEDLRGLTPIVRPFHVEHPEMCFQRRPGDEDPGGTLRAIRLFSPGDAPIGVDAADVSIWTGDINGRWDRYDGEFMLSESTEWRPLFPLGRTCRVLTLGGLSIPADRRYVEVRFGESAFGSGEFRNEYHQIVELLNDRGEVIPCTPAACLPYGAKHIRLLDQPWMQQLVRYGHRPEVKAHLAETDAAAAAEDMRDYGRAPGAREYPLDERRHLAVARGKMPYLFNLLNPAYPEVRGEWLRVVQFCIDRGVDAVSIRGSNHGRVQEYQAYGFNPPVLARLDGRADWAGARRVIGDAYTQFIREARELLHAHGRRIGVHVASNYLRGRDEWAEPFDDHLEYQWETWLDGLADFATFRGAMGFREESLQYVVDRIAGACRDAGVPLFYQANRRSFVGNKPDALHLEPDRLRWLEYEMEYALHHPDISGYQLYETASFTCIDEAGQFHGSEDIREVARKFGFATD